VDNRGEVRDFLASRRARITPDRAGLPVYGGHRRVPGLRRDTGLTMLVYTAGPGTSTQDALTLLASWAATLDQPAAARDHA
jgi:hypothetical protein